MEAVFANFPIKLNPIHALAIQLLLVFVPHFAKIPYLHTKLKKEGKKYDIASSRAISQEQSAKDSYLAALVGCHTNNFEALIYFAVAVLASLVVAGAKNSAALSYEVVEGFAGLFIASRVLYTAIYMTPSLNGVLRSIAFIIGLASTAGLLLAAAGHYHALKA